MVARIVLFFLLLSAAPCLIFAEDSVRVAILPFSIHAQDEMDLLQNRLGELLEKQLSKEGISAVLFSRKTIAQEDYIDNKDWLRSFGQRRGVDFVITGSLTLIGGGFSLDAEAVSCDEARPSYSFYVQGEGLETLLDRIQKLAGRISDKIFERKNIVRINIAGNRRIEAEAIKRVIKAREKGPFLKKELSDDLKRVYGMGYFDDVRIESADIFGGREVTFHVKEKPIIRNMEIKGNDAINDDKIKEALDIKTGSTLNIRNVRNNMEIIEDLYKEKEYHNVCVTFETKAVEEDQVDLLFTVKEGERILIKEIIFEGNVVVGSDDLQDVMETSEKGFFSWLTSSGELDPEKLDMDIARIVGYYNNHGYIRTRVGEPEIAYKDEWIYVTIKIEEGPQFGIGEVTLEGDLIRPEEELTGIIEITKEEVYNREVIRNDVLALVDVYSDAGYAYADIAPRMKEDPDNLKVDIVYTITKGEPVYFEEILITGNTRTRDKVIRRQLDIYEQELFSGKRLRQSSQNLYRLDYFEDIKVNTGKGSSDNKMNLHIEVKDKPTGAFSFGGGYSSVDKLFVMGSISQRNLFGRGQTLMLQASIGGRSNIIDLSFTEPWLFDTPVSAGFDLYKRDMDYDTYDKLSKGGRLRFGYRITNYTRVFFYYGLEENEIREIQDDASQDIKDMVEDLGEEYLTSGITGMVSRDSRDRVFNATEGSNNKLSLEWAGGLFGGDVAFTKYIGESGWYFPLFWSTVGMLRAEAGFVSENSSGALPVYERFFLGGMNSVRGYEWRDIGPKDPITGDPTGGNKMLQFNVEYVFPLIKDAGFMGLLFFDAGQAYDDDESMDLGNLRQSAGYGVRWYSPMGPLRLEYGYVIDREPGESKGRWEFSIGSVF